MTLLEAFELGKALQSFMASSHCYDARDIGRFWMLDGHPKWVEELGKEYDRQVNWMGDKDHGLVVAHRVIRQALAAQQKGEMT